MSKYILIVFGVLLLAVAVGFFLIQTKFGSAPVASPSAVATISGLPTPKPTPEFTREFTITATEFAFSPSTLTVKKGDVVRVNFVNNGTMPHNLTFADFDIATQTIKPGEAGAIRFNADKTGTFGFSCTIDSHADKGMRGTIVVE